MNRFENEIPKHKKKTSSSISKAKEKSKHKHTYTDCIAFAKDGHISKARYCTICGKFNSNIIETIKCGNGCVRLLPQKEILEKYKNLEKIYVEDLWQKYIELDKKQSIFDE